MPAVRDVIHRVQVIAILIITGNCIITFTVVNAVFRFAIDGDIPWVAAKLSVIDLLINFLSVGFIRIEGKFQIRLIPFGELTQAFQVIGISGIRVADNFVCAFY